MRAPTRYSLGAATLALASGIMLAAAFPKVGLSFLVWLGVAPLILAARMSSTRAAAFCGLLAGALFFGVVIEWIRIFDTTGWVLLLVVQGAYLGLFAALVRHLFPSPSGWPGVLGPAAVWTALEWVRSLTRAGFTWGDLAYALHGQIPLMQAASVVGPFGLTFLVVLANAAIAALLGTLLNREVGDDRWRPATGRLAVVAALVGTVWACGAWRVRQPLPAARPVRIALVQGNVLGEGRDEPWNTEKIRETVRVYLALSQEAARQRPDVILWPESAVPDYLLLRPGIRDEIAAGARRLHANLIVGGAHFEAPGRRLNSAFLFDRGGRPAGRYDKVHLVPYGEYTPWRHRLAWLYQYFPVRSIDYSSGRGFVPLRTDVGRVGVAICFESAFPGITRALRRNGAPILAILTNDAWFGLSAATWQHYHMSAFRAVECGAYLARVATTGFSAVLDPYGRAVAETTLFSRRILVADVRPAPGLTLYMRVGDIVAWACAAVVGWVLVGRRRAW